MPDLRCLLPFIVLLAGNASVRSETRVTIATVNNGDMIIMQKLSQVFEKQNPDIKLDWVILEENVLRGRVTTDIATQGAQFDIMTIGTYEAAIWGKRNWLVRLDDDLPASYDLNDVLKPIRDGLSYETRLYAFPFMAKACSPSIGRICSTRLA